MRLAFLCTGIALKAAAFLLANTGGQPCITHPSKMHEKGCKGCFLDRGGESAVLEV